MILADKIIEQRKKLGLSQEELAEKLGVKAHAAALLDADANLTAYFCEDFGLLAVCFFFFAFDIIPLTVPGHEHPPN